jgi:phosphatidylserine decarboxylase
MKMSLTKFGWPQIALWPAAVLAAMLACVPVARAHWPGWLLLAVELLLGLALLFVLAFFRDPHRVSPDHDDILLAPADGTITDVEHVDSHDYIGGPALRIGIFLSIFNVHINRAPCDARVETITYRRGKKKNAMNPKSASMNESNDVGLIRTVAPQHRLLVRQISGAVARRIVCAAKSGDVLTGGQKFGMIKFGSRTELYVPAHAAPGGNADGAQPMCLVKIGDKVKAGISPVVRYEQCRG